MDYSKNYYRALELRPTASQTDIRKAYRALAHKYHPDKNTGNNNSAEIFRDIKEAYEVLSNPLKKRQYDTVRSTPFSTPYSFSKHTGANSSKDENIHVKEKSQPEKPENKNLDWLKPVILIVIALISVWVISHLRS
jgi:curved DNA-binding protein CbpA